jgi:hypothetical protein
MDAAPETGSKPKQKQPFRLYRIGSAYSAEQGLRRKRKHHEVDEGLFVEHAAKYMQSNSIKVQWTPPKDHYIPLSGGDSSNTFLSRDGKVVYKFYLKEEEARKEWKMVRHVMELAPRYIAGPAHFYMAQGGHVDNCGYYYILSTQYAGETLEKRQKERPLTPDEQCLGLLQAIHFTLLLGSKILVRDIHAINICVSKAGSAIEIRWIDFVKWKVPMKEEDKRCCLPLNVERLLNAEGWKSWRDSDANWLCCEINGRLRHLQTWGKWSFVVLINLLLKLTNMIHLHITERRAKERGSELLAHIAETATRLAEQAGNAEALACIQAFVLSGTTAPNDSA